jgi:hypothetical protein
MFTGNGHPASDEQTLTAFVFRALNAALVAPEAVFRREGDFWTIAYAGKAFLLRDLKGLRYLGFLLGSPGKEIHALELAEAAAGLGPTHARSSNGAGPLLDTQAKAAYRSRLDQLGDDLRQAEEWGDPERIAGIKVEIDALTDELARSAGLGGRARDHASPAERARISVTKAIRAAIRRIERHSPELAAHLAASVRTGRFCSYATPGEPPPAWNLRTGG